MKTNMSNETVRAKLDEFLSRGLCSGSGTADGQVCVEQAIALACGEKLTDSPTCVSPVVRAFAIRLNDASWSSPQARAYGLRAFALAQLGTRGLDERRFVTKLAELTMRRVLPIALRAVGLPVEADRCEKEGTATAAAAAYAANADDALRESATCAIESIAFAKEAR